MPLDLALSATFSPAASLSTGKWRLLCLMLGWLALFVMVVTPLSDAAQILYPAAWQRMFPASWDVPPVKLHDVLDLRTVPMVYRTGILLCELVTIALAMWCLWSMHRLFLSFARGEVFTATALRHLNQIALALLLGEIADILSLLPESLLASWSNGPGHHDIMLNITGEDISSLLWIGTAFVIARVMADARRIADDHAEIV
jgi:hypothetical protein